MILSLSPNPSRILDDIRTLRRIYGDPKKITIIRRLIKRRPFVRTVVPEGWMWK